MNTCTEQITVTIVDDLSPIVTTQDVIIDLDVNGQATITENQVITSATDNCAVTEIVITQLAFDCTNIGENVVTVQAADAAGNITTTSVTVTVRDLIAPTAVAQDITVSLDANGQATISTGDIDNGSDDNCSFTTSIDKTSFDCNEVGDNTVTLTVTDASGNTSTATATVTVIEDILPVIVPANITVDLDEDGEASILPTQVYTSITDNCSVVSIEVDPLDFDCDDLGDNTVTITATDANGNVATATAIVTVRDVTPPTVVTKNINVGLNASGTVTIAPEDVIRFNCGGGGGVSVPEPVPGAGSAVEFFAPNCTSDNCGIASYTVSQTTFDCNDAGQNIVTVTVTDGSGNVTTETAIVNVIDTTKPKVKAKNVTVELDENGIATITTTDVDDNSSDSCGAVTLTLSKTTFNCEDIGNNQVTLIGTDANGNTDTDNATVTVVDNTAPVVVTQDITVSLNMYGQATIDPKDLLIICDDAVIEEDNGGGGGGFVPGAGVTAVAFDNNLPAPPTCTKDNCKITAIMASIEQFDCNHIGTNLVTITVTDGQGNSTTATATVTVVDPIAPTAVAQDIFVDLDANGQATIDADDIDNGSDDNCNFTKSIDKTDFDCSDVGPSQVVTLTVTDQAGNTAVATANVTVRDLIAPTAVAQDITVSLDANGQATISTGDIDNGSDDNCSFTTSIDKTSFDCNEVGDNTVTLTVTDASGNTSTATATVTVIEDILPVIVPANITVDLDEDGEASILPTQVYTSITDNCSVVSIEVDPLDFDCDDLGDNTVTVTATDANGNVATATAIVTVRDVTPPTVVTKNINVGLNASGTVTIAPEDVIRFNCGGGGGVSVPEPVPGAGSAVEFFAPNCTSDNCGIASYTVSQTTFDCNDAGQNIVTVTVTDGSGNVTTETAIVNVIDTTKPKVKAKNVTVELDENGIATITTTDVDDNSSDSCGAVTLTLSKTTFNCEDIGNNQVTLIGTDANGNTDTDNATVTVVDNTAPVVVTQDITVSLNMYGQATIDPKDLLIICDDAVIEEDNGGGGGGFVPGAGVTAVAFDNNLPAPPTCTKDNCKITAIMASIEQFDCNHIGTNLVTITVTDGQGNSTTATATVTVVDPIAPTAVAQDIFVDLDANGQATIDADDIDNGSDDNCNFTKSIDKTDFDCSDVGPSQVVTLTVTDQAGNTAVATANVTVRDLIAPTAVAQDITVSLDANGQATISTGDIDNGSDDNCSFTTSIDKTSFDCNEVGDNTVTLTVTDASGNTSTATATVTVIEDILPVIVPANITVDLDEDGEASILPTQVYTSITDNCSVVSIEVDPLDFDCDDLGDNTVTITATDANGNVATATAIVTVRDVTPPTVVTKNINVGLNASGTVTIAPEDVIRFNCGGGGGVSVPEPVPGAGSAVEFFAPNCTSDNCGIASYTVSQTTFDCNDAGQNIVTVTVTDGSGNVTTETAIVNVIDTTKPKVKAKNVTVELDENGIATITTTDVDDNSSDSCGAVTLTLSKTTFNCEDIGNNQVTLIGTDANGNTDTDNATVTVVDNTAPVVVTQDITVSLNMYGQATIDPKDLLIICDDAVIEEDNGGGGGGFVPGAGVTAVAFDNNLPAPPTCTKDNCKITAIMASIEQFDCNHIGTNLVTITVTDGQGNSTTATATVTVVDPIAPTAVAQDIFVDLDANGQATIDADDIDNGSDDNCNFTKSIDKTDFDCSDVGPSQVVTLTVTDQAGNTAVATANVTVRDLIAPTAVAQDITVSLDANGQATISTGDIDNGSDDNCSFTTSIDKTSFDCNEVGDNTVTLTVTDASGNTSTATATVTVIEDILPVIVPANITVDLDEDGEASILPTQVYTSITDNCSVVSIEVDPLDFDCDDLGDNTVTVTATDANGNVATATAIVTVRDVTPPTVVTKNINVGLNASGTVTIAPEDVIRFNCGGGGGVSVPEPVPGAGSAVEFFAPNCTSDNCGIASYTVSQTTFDCNDAGQNIVTVTVTDGSGNVTTETAIVNVIDTTKPKVKAKNVTVELDENGIATITTTDVDDNSSDSCGAVTLTLSKTTFNCEDIGNNQVTLIGTDANGNTDTDNATVTVVDNTAPVVVTQDITVSLNMYGQATIDPKDLLIICDDAVIEEDNGGGGGGFVPGAGVTAVAFDNNLPAPPTCTKDNCKITAIMASIEQFDCNHIGTNLVTITVTDGQGNSTTATATVTVVDPIAPTAVAQDIFVDLDANGQATIDADDIDNGSDDNCNFTKSIDKTDFDCSDVGPSQVVTLTVTDQAGNTAVATANVTVRDLIAPTAVAQDITVSLDANGQATISTGDIDNGSDDNCSFTTSIDKTSFDCNEVGDNTVTLTVTDASGNASTATATVTVIEDILPVIVPANITVDLDEDGEASILPTQVYTSITDNCSVVSIEVDPLDFDCDDLGDNTVTVTATDANGNVATATAIVTVRDVTPPTVVTKNINVGLNASGTVTIAPEDVIRFNCGGGGGVSVPEPVPGAGSAVEFFAPNCTSDNCGIASYTVSQTTFDCNDAGQNIVTVTVTDGSGNVTTETAIVNVIDTTKPKVKAKNVTVELDENGIATITTTDVDDNSSDSCGAVTLTLSKTTFNCEDIGNNQVTLIGTDANGNTDTDNATVTVVDNTAPVVVTQDITVSLNMYGQATIDPKDLLIICDDAVIEEDNGGGGGGFVPGAGVTAVAFDNNLPAPPTCTKDNCKITAIMASIEQFDCNHIGTNLVTITVTDGQGNSTTATATVTVVDPIAPTAVAQDIFVDLDANGQATIDADDIDNGSDDNCNFTKSIDKTDFDCSDVGPSQVVTLTVTDQAGNTAVATANVTVRDLIAPTAVAQDITVSLDANGQATISTGDIDNGSDDNCSFTTSIDKTSFDCNEVGDNTVTLTVTDASGNASTATATVTVIDAIAPTATTQDLVVQLDANGQVSITAAQINNGSSDNCGIDTITIDTPEFDCNNLGPNAVTMTVTDVNGLSSTATALVTVQDLIAPVIIPQNITVDLDASGQVTISESQVYSSITDNCSVTEIFVGPLTFDCSDLGDNTVTIQAADAGGNITSSTAIVTVRDVTAPNVIAQNLTINLDANGNASITTAQIDNGSSDNCDLTLNLDQLDFDCDDLGANTVILTGTDTSGNTATANAIVTVVDNTAPVITTQNISISLDANGNAIITEGQVATATDNCGTPDITISQTNFDCTNLGDNTVTVTATDASGNESTASVSVTIADTTAPTVITQNVSVNLDANGNVSVTVAQIDNGSSDNCNLTLTLDQLDFDCTHVGDNTVTLTGTDASGNTASATAIITVIDNNPVTITPTDITVVLDANGMASIDADDLLDNTTTECTVAKFGNSNSHAVWLSKYTATNQNVNFQFDSNGGTLTQNADGTATVTGTIVNKDDANDSWLVQLNLSDRRDWNDWSALGRSWKGNANKVGTNYLNWDYYEMDTNPSNPTTLTGLGSNTGKVKTLSHKPANLKYGFQVGTAANDKDTDLGMSGWFTYQNDQGKNVQGDFNLDITNCTTTIGSGSCGEATIEISQTDFDCTDAGENTVTIIATTPNNVVTTETVTVTIVDDITPTVITQDITVNLDANGNASVTVAQIDNGSSDNCNLTLSLDELNFDCSDLGANTVTLTGTDASGNTASATATVTVVDNTDPVITTQNITVDLDANGQATITESQVITSVTDNCSITETVVTQTAFDCSDIGDNTVTVQAADAAGNITTTSVIVTVRDNTAPTVITQDVTVNLDANGNASVTVAQIDNGSSDNCNLTLSLDELNFDCSDLGANTVTLTGTDASGNTASATATVTVVDNTDPVITTQNITVDLDANGQATITESQVITSVTDNCSITETVVTQTAFDCSDIGDNTVTVQAADAAGNITTTSVIVTVRDNTAPTVITQDVTVNLDANGNASVTVAQIDNGSSDNCNLTLSLDELNFDCSDLGANTVTLTGTDASGNTASATATVTVVDNTDPVITTQNITVDLDASGQATITESQVITSVTDNCSITETVVTQTAFDCSDIGDNTVTVQAADAAGNITTTSVIVTVRDNTAPTVITQDVTVNLDANGNASVTVAQIDNGSSDNCNLTLSLDELNFDCSDLGANTVTLTGTDVSGNTASTTAIVTVVDNNAPVINSQNVTLELDANGQASLNPADVLTNETYEECEVTAYQGNSNHSVALRHYFPNNSNFIDFVFDNNGGKLTQFADGTATVRGTIVNPTDNNDSWAVVLNLIDKKDWNEWSAMGRSWKGNSNTVGNSYQNWSYYIMDTNPSNPSTLTGLGSNAGESTAITHMPANYNFGFQIGQAANDKNGNYGMSGWFFYTNYNGDLVQGDFNMDITTCSTLVDEGPCGNAELTIDQTQFDCTDLGANTVTITLIDANNNSSSETITVTIEDNIAPTVIAQNATVNLDANGNASITIAQIDNGSSDNCNLTLSLDELNFDCSDLGANTVTLTGTDASGNTASATAIVTVVDNVAPVANAQNITAYLDANGQASITASQINNGSNDNCGISTVSVSTTSFDCNDLGANTVTLTVTDLSGNTSTTSATVTIVDNVLPVITQVPSDIVYQELDANCGESIFWNLPTATDNCQVSLTGSHNSGDTFPVGTTTVTYTATDNAGNSTLATFDITVVAAPVTVALNISQSLTCSDDEIGAIDASANGGCGTYTYLWSNGATTSSINNLEAGTYSVTVSDGNGGSATTSINLEASNTLEITGTVSPEYPVANGGDLNTIYLGYGEQTVTLTANVTGGNAPYTYVWFPESAIACTSDNSVVVAPQQTTTYTVLVTDATGCTTTESFDINVVDVRCEDGGNVGAGQANTTNNIGSTYNGNSYKGKGIKGGNDDDDDDKGHDDDDKGGDDDDDDNHGDDDDDDNGGDDDDDNDNGGGDNNSGSGDDCQCEGRMENFTFVYNGVSGVTIKAYNKKYTYLIEEYQNVQNGDVITVEGFDKHGRLEAKTHLRVGSSFYEIHTSCSINILGETYGPFTITGYTDGEGSSCTLDNDNDDDGNQGCEAQAADAGGHALWLSAYSANGNSQFFFDNNSGSFTTLDNGKAKLTGIVSNRTDTDDKWQIEFFFSDAMNWSQWSALGRSYKDEAGVAGNKYLDWTYYIMDPNEATKLTGLGNNAGEVKTLSHKPSDYYLGFQLGEAANNKNAKYGLSGWFSYKNYRGQWVQGDINLDLENCQNSEGDCDTSVTLWAGDVSMCLNGQSICIDPDDVDYYLGLGATLGSCSTSQAPLSGGAVNNGEANDENELTVTPEITITAYPNPTRSVANITFTVSESGPVGVGIYSTKGLLIGTLYEGMAEADTEYKVVFDGSNVTEGVYMIRLRTAGFLETKKLIIKR